MRNGQSYLAALRDRRRVLYEDQIVEDVTAAPGFCAGAAAVAQFYDFQSDAAARDIMARTTPEGETAGTAFLQPRSREDLRRRAAACAAWADISCGFLGRSPDYMNTCLSALGALDPVFSRLNPRLEGHAGDIYLRARRGDLCFTHTFVRPFNVHPPALEAGGPDRAGALQLPTRVTESEEGLIINGLRGLATLAPFSNMSLDLMLSATVDGKEGTPHVVIFVVPTNARGLTWVCRDLISTGEPHASSPLACRADEVDCMALYQDCLIPWRDVVLLTPAGPSSLIGKWYPRMMSGLQHHTIIRSIAKMRFMVGLAHLLVESSRVNQFVSVKERMGEMVHSLCAMEAFAVAAIERAFEDEESGVYYPHAQTTQAAVAWSGELHARMVNHLLDLGAGRYVSAPHEKTLEALGLALEGYLRGATLPGRANVALHRLAWDVVGSRWGARQLLYERFHFGPPAVLKADSYEIFDLYDKAAAVAMVRRILDAPPSAEERFPNVPPKEGASPNAELDEGKA